MNKLDDSPAAVVSEFLGAARRQMREEGATEPAAVLHRWAGSGAMALTGRPKGAPRPEPAPIVIRIEAAARALTLATRPFANPLVVDGPALLGERAAFTQMTRRGSTSVGEAAQMVRVADGWVVLNLARPEDTACLPALVSRAVDIDDWTEISSGLLMMTGAQVLAQGQLLGMAVAVVGEHRSPEARGLPGRVALEGKGRSSTDSARIVDLSSLWAGPLAGGLLHQAGANVVKVESARRPDGARRGPRGFFDLLNSGKEEVVIDFDSAAGRRQLHGLLESADLVISANRPRAWAPLGIDPAGLVLNHRTSWLAITAHGPAAPDRIGFGDDAAVAAGLVIEAVGDHPPMFVADAVADPVTGLLGALYSAVQLQQPCSTLVELSLRDCAGWVRRSTDEVESTSLPRFNSPVVVQPHARSPK